MRTYPFYQVDAFTSRPLTGNPCAVILHADDLSTAEMQAIARENNLSETAFVIQPSNADADFAARYFTPSLEIPMAGHPTIATIHTLVETGSIEIQDSARTVRLQLPAGIFPVTVTTANKWAQKPADSTVTPGVFISMRQKAPDFLRTYRADELLPICGLASSDFNDSAPQTVSTGTPQLMIALKNRTALEHIRIDNQALDALYQQGDFFSVHFFCLEQQNGLPCTFARHFVPPPNAFEDPFTGSATGGMAAYLWQNGLLTTTGFWAYQGAGIQRPGEAWVEVLPVENKADHPHAGKTAPAGVSVSGQAVTVITGQINVPQSGK